MMVCWCGHLKSEHGHKTVKGFDRVDACLVCPGFTCDEWQIEFCNWEEAPGTVSRSGPDLAQMVQEDPFGSS